MTTKACVIGAGPGGYVSAIRLAQLGIETVLVEKMTSMGGVCLNWGCIPSKAFIGASRMWADLGHLDEIGITVNEPSFDMARMKAWKDGIVDRLTSGISHLLKRHNITVLRGTASFKGPTRLQVTAPDGKTTEIEAENFVIATGSASIQIPGFDVDQKHILTSRGALELKQVPEHVLIIGGGVIGLEIGQCLQRLGSKLTVVEMMDQLLPGVDADCVKVVARALKKAGAKIHLKARAKSALTRDGIVRAKIETAKGEIEIQADRVLIAVGRTPNTKELGLKDAGVETDARGFVSVDAQQRTSNGRIFAIGDVAGGMLLAHKASREGLVAAAAIAGPAAIFTEPEIGTVGISEANAAEEGMKVKVGSFPFAASGRALASRETAGMVKIIADASDDRILGVHICGPHASELIGEGALAIEAGLTAEDLALTVHTHPTLSEAMMEAAEDVHRVAIHIFNPPK